MEFFYGRKAVIATKHHKDLVIKPLFEKELGLICITPQNLDTDLLGTFSGEIARIEDPLTTLKKKCCMAIDITGIDIAIANEGSFGPHPTIFFANADDEFIMLYDKKNGLEIIERELSLETNFSGIDVASEQELVDFAHKVGFPEHGIILKRAKDEYTGMVKNSIDIRQLVTNYNKIKATEGKVYAETDMRAMHNPTRMKNIENAAKKLIAKIKSTCPKCGVPGFGETEAVSGLPCTLCGIPTKSILKHIYSCKKCNHKSEVFYPSGKTSEDPQYCDMCNP